MSHTLTVRWRNDPPGDWWEAAEFTLTNTGSTDLVDPLIEFTVGSDQQVSDNSGLLTSRPEGSNRVRGRLAEWLSPIKAGQSIVFSVGIAPLAGPGVGKLPYHLTVDGDGGEEPTGPGAPGNPRIASTAATGLLVEWDPAGGPAPIRHYVLAWGTGTSTQFGDTTTGTRFVVEDLEPDTLYQVQIAAVDVEGRRGPTVSVSARTDREDGPGPGPGPTGRWDVPSAPFLDLCRYPSPRIADYTAAGAKGLFLGFAVAGKHEATRGRLTWGGNQEMWDSVSQEGSSGIVAESTYKLAEIRAMQSQGFTPILSIGGAAGGPIEQDVTDVDAIVAEYEEVLDQYGLSHLDFDFEGGVEHDGPAMARHVQAITKLLARRPGLRYSYTLSVNTFGFNSGGKNLLSTLAKGGLRPHAIQGMLMEMGELSQDRWEVARRSTEAMVVDIRNAGFGWTDTEIWQRIGMCPMYGRNNDGTKFTLDHMRLLVEFAREHDVAVVSGWDAYRDHNQWRIPQCSTNEGSDNGMCTYVQQEPLDFSRLAADYTHRPAQRHLALPAQRTGTELVVPITGEIVELAGEPCRGGDVTVRINVEIDGRPAGAQR